MKKTVWFGAGLSITSVIALFVWLQLSGISITAPDIKCMGNELNPCNVLITFKNPTNISYLIKSKNVQLLFSPIIKSYELREKYYNSWRLINWSKGTTIKAKGKTYWNLTVSKNSPTDNVKWTLKSNIGVLDPLMKGYTLSDVIRIVTPSSIQCSGKDFPQPYSFLYNNYSCSDLMNCVFVNSWNVFVNDTFRVGMEEEKNGRMFKYCAHKRTIINPFNITVLLSKKNLNLTLQSYKSLFDTTIFYDNAGVWSLINNTNIPTIQKNNNLSLLFFGSPKPQDFVKFNINAFGMTEDPFWNTSDNPPTINNVTTNTISDGNITATPVGVSDPDGDNTTVNYDWRVNGSSIAVLNMPMTGPFDNGLSNLTFDFSTYNNIGVLGNGVQSQKPSRNNSGIIGNSYNFDGTNDFINLGNAPSLNVQSFVTVSGWINPSVNTGTKAVVGKAYTLAQSESYLLYLNNADINLRITTGGGTSYTDISASGLLTVNKWTYFAGTYDGSIMSIYINGTLINTAAKTGSMDNNQNVTIGARIYTSSGGRDLFFQGQIDEVQIYNKSLSATEIFAIYNNSAPRYDRIVSNEVFTGDNWSVFATPIDSQGLNGTGVLNTTAAITNIEPHIDLILPLNATQFLYQNRPFNFSWNVTDDANTSLNCDLLINNSINVSLTGVSSGANSSTIVNLSRGFDYTWGVNCTDGTLTNQTIFRIFNVNYTYVKYNASLCTSINRIVFTASFGNFTPKNVSAANQTSSGCLLNITNDDVIPGMIVMRVNQTQTNFSPHCGFQNTSVKTINLSTIMQFVNTTEVLPGQSKGVFCYLDYLVYQLTNFTSSFRVGLWG